MYIAIYKSGKNDAFDCVRFLSDGYALLLEIPMSIGYLSALDSALTHAGKHQQTNRRKIYLLSWYQISSLSELLELLGGYSLNRLAWVIQLRYRQVCQPKAKA